MSAALKHRMTVDEFLAWEIGREPKCEFDGAEPVPMNGVTFEHADIEGNLMAALRARLRGTEWRACGPSLRMRTPSTVRYPDVMVVRLPTSKRVREISDPVIVFEILSESTAQTDLGAKNREYRDTPSVQRYVILDQAAIGATVFRRVSGDWIGSVHGPEDTIDMPEIGIALPIAELYEGVEFDLAPARE